MQCTALFNAVILSLACASGAAQTTPGIPSTSQLQQERARIEAERKQMFDARNPTRQPSKGALPNAQAVEREVKRIEGERKALFDPANPATMGPRGAFPNIETPARAHVDVESLARRYEEKAQARKLDGLMVFASFTMPKGSLKRLVADTARAGGVVVMRGFKDGSIKSTGLAIGELGEAAGGVQVSPNAFTKYRVSAVPAVVLVKPDGPDQVDAEGCALPDLYVRVAGDVGLAYALDEVAKRSTDFKDMAARYARPLRGSALR